MLPATFPRQRDKSATARQIHDRLKTGISGCCNTSRQLKLLLLMGDCRVCQQHSNKRARHHRK
eukprot:4525352-Amphidinium_carterae.1